MKFKDLKAHKSLTKLAENAPDLSKPNCLDGERVKKMVVKWGHWRMTYSTERVDDRICEELCDMARQADVKDKMWLVQNMEKMNYVNNCRSEERMVGHAAIRNPNPSNKYSDEVKKASQEYQVELKKLGKFLSKSDHFKYMIVVGIGGSYLGTLAIEKAWKNFQETERELFFASNVDPDKIASILEKVDMKKTAVAIVSKSGNTLEIMSQETLLRKRFREAGLVERDHFLMVTGEGSPMDKPEAYSEIFYMWDHIGGRYSVSSMVGALPLAFLYGMRMWEEFLRGLHDMDQHALNEEDPQKNLPLWGALLNIWNRNFLNCDTHAIIPYSAGMVDWSLHLQQLFMESNGKSVCKEDGTFVDFDTCPVIWGTIGTEGQHSYYQAIHQGTKKVPIEFIVFRNAQLDGDEIIEGSTNQEKLISNAIAQSIGLATGQHSENNNQYFSGSRQNRMLLTNRLDAYTLGNLLAYYEHLVAFQGFIWNINSFDQEGVQLGKLLANGVIDLYKEKRERGKISMARKTEVARAFLEELEKTSDDRGSNNNMRSG